jgi:chromosome segregation ATPase
MEDAKEERVVYSTPLRVQVWFLGRSRDKWKQKAKARKEEAKRWRNRAADVSKSRDRWRQGAAPLRQRVAELEAQNTALSNQSAAGKKGGLGTQAQPGR